MKNIELKAKYPNLKKAEKLAQDLDAAYEWCKTQEDTYFTVNQGRLKLRETEGKIPELISYFRSDTPKSKESKYQLLKVPDGDCLKQMLAATLGTVITVKKKRTLYLHENVRIHLDEVEKLGNFVELEGVIVKAGQIEKTENHITRLRNHLNITKNDLIDVSYCDLLLRKENKATS